MDQTDILTLRKSLTLYLKISGPENLAKLISTSIDLAGPANVNMKSTRANFSKKFDKLSQMDLSDRLGLTRL